MEGIRTSLLQIVSISFTFYTKLENFTVHQCQKLLWYQSEGSQIDNRTQLRKMTKCGKTTPSTYNVKKLSIKLFYLDIQTAYSVMNCWVSFSFIPEHQIHLICLLLHFMISDIKSQITFFNNKKRKSSIFKIFLFF